MANPLAAYSMLGNLRNKTSNSSSASNFMMSKSIAEERRKEADKREDREERRGVGRLLGTGGSLLASLLFAPLTAGMSIPMQMLLAGAATGAGSLGGQKIASGKRMNSGMWDIDEDKKMEDQFEDQMVASAGSDALSSALTTGAGKGLNNLFKDGSAALDAENAIDASKISKGMLKHTSPIRLPESNSQDAWTKLLESMYGY